MRGKLFTICLIFVLISALMFAACGKNEPAAPEEEAIRLGGLTGPTTMGMVKLLEEAETGEGPLKLDVTIAGTADELAPKLIKGELDIAAIPSNLAAVLYNKTEGEIQLLSLNVRNVLYILEQGSDTVQNRTENLKGKTIYCTGKGSTPEYYLRFLLEREGIDPDRDVTLEFKSEPAEIVALMAAAEKDGKTGLLAMLPQPYVTVAQSKIKDLTVALNIGGKLMEPMFSSQLSVAMKPALTPITAVTVVRRSFAEAHPEEVKTFLEELEHSVEWVNENPAEAALLVEKYIGVSAAVAEKAIPNCSLFFESGEEAKATMELLFFPKLFEMEPTILGGQIPGDDFYYIP